MTDVHVSLPPALRRALDLLTDPPAEPDAGKGYLDLLGAESADVPKNTGPIQAAWASPIGSMLYDNAQAFLRRLIAALQHPAEWLDIPPGGTALDVGSGPGTVTASLARAAGRTDSRWAWTFPRLCWPARCATRPARTSASYALTHNDFRCAPIRSTRWSRWRCCNWFRIRPPPWPRWRGCCDRVDDWR